MRHNYFERKEQKRSDLFMLFFYNYNNCTVVVLYTVQNTSVQFRDLSKKYLRTVN